MTPISGPLVQRFVELGLWEGRRGFGECQAIGFADGRGLAAGVVFHNYDPDANVIELSAYSARRDWLTRGRLIDLFSYPFDQLGCRIAVARISEHNKRALRIWRSLGASQHPLPDLRSDGEAEVVCLLKRDTFKAKFEV